MPSSRIPLRAALVCAALAAAACGSKSQTVDPPVPDGPAIQCPANITVDAEDVTGTSVSFASPVVTGGAPPVAVSCSPASTSVFPVGTTTVSCAASDGLQRQAPCAFTVTVNKIPQLKGTRFSAFGDSFTAGVVVNPVPQAIDSSVAWPKQLELLLRSRYKLQTPIVTAFGKQEETISQESVDRLAGNLRGSQPDAVLILEGINNVNQSSEDSMTLDDIQTYTSAAIRVSFEAGAKAVFVSTLPPKGTCAPGYPECNDNNAYLVPQANARISQAAIGANVFLVDNYTAISTNVRLYIGEDGLHPTVAGHLKIAQTFFDSIKLNFEQPAASLSGLLSIRR